MKKGIDWLDWEILDYGCKEVAYPLDKAKARYEVRNICDGGYLILNRAPFEPGDDSGWLRFAVLDWLTSDCDESNVYMRCLFHGDGPYGTLHEPRHFYFGEEGYLFYPKASVIKSGLDALSEFFDFY